MRAPQALAPRALALALVVSALHCAVAGKAKPVLPGSVDARLVVKQAVSGGTCGWVSATYLPVGSTV
jgi:hypothetical protein